MSGQWFRVLIGFALGAAIGFLIGGVLIIGNPNSPCVFLDSLFGGDVFERSSFSAAMNVLTHEYPDCMNNWGFFEWLIVAVCTIIGYFIGSRVKREIEDATTIGGA